MAAGFLSDVRTLKSQARRNGRLPDQSGKQHIKQVETWFKSNIENEIQELENRVRTALLGLVMQDQHEASRQQGQILVSPPLRKGNKLRRMFHRCPEMGSVGIDRATVDLEQLRPTSRNMAST